MSNIIDNLDNIKNIYFIGIGGSGMFPLASILHSKGFNVSGSDNYESDTLEKVRKLGIKVFNQHKGENTIGSDLIVYSAAIKDSNPEIIYARDHGIPTIERSTMLGIIVDKYKNSIAIAGTHGKTTTTSMLTHILINSEKDPSAVIGGTLPSIGSNGCVGESDIMVCEACEYVDSFLKLHPRISIIQNVEPDHLDYFKSFDNIKKSFNRFASQTKDIVIVNGDDKMALESINGTEVNKITYGILEKNDFSARNIVLNDWQFASFDLFKGEELICKINLSIPGKHNIYNAVAAAVAAYQLGVSENDIANALHSFSGVHRRFEILYNQNNIVVADDFAHHPTEISNTINTAMKMGFKRVWAIFQPHTFSRTFMFLDDFAKALSMADRVIVSEILPVREINTYNIYAEDLVAKIPNGIYLKTFEEITDYIIKNVSQGDLVLTMGGGNIYKCANSIVEKLKK